MAIIIYRGDDLSPAQLHEWSARAARAIGTNGDACVVCQNKDELAQAITEACAQHANADHQMPFRTADGNIYFLRLQDIHYFRSASHRVIACMADGSELSSKTLRISARAFLGSLIENGTFLQVSRSTFVNISHIVTVTADAVYLPNDISLPLSRKYYAQYASAARLPNRLLHELL